MMCSVFNTHLILPLHQIDIWASWRLPFLPTSSNSGCYDWKHLFLYAENFLYSNLSLKLPPLSQIYFFFFLLEVWRLSFSYSFLGSLSKFFGTGALISFSFGKTHTHKLCYIIASSWKFQLCCSISTSNSNLRLLELIAKCNEMIEYGRILQYWGPDSYTLFFFCQINIY